ncbi:hypothetical protein ACHAXT_002059 [Thalassiosira profunda]
MVTRRSAGPPRPRVFASAGDVIAALKCDAAAFQREDFAGEYRIDFEVSDEMEEAVLPHWKGYLEEDIASSNPENQIWTFLHVKLPTVMLEMLQSAMASRNIHSLEFSLRPNDSPTNLLLPPFITSVLGENSSIRRLAFKWGFCWDGGMLRAVENHPSLEELHVGMRFHENQPMLGRILRSSRSLKYLNLRSSTIGDEGGDIISRFLQKNYDLEYLDLGRVKITDADAKKIALSLAFNTKLRVLNLAGKTQGISVAGRTVLRRALLSATAFTQTPGRDGAMCRLGGLDSIARCNHTCSVKVVSSIDPCPLETLFDVLNQSSCPKDNRRLKILSYLYARKGEGSRTEVGDFQRRKLIPDILAYIAQVSECTAQVSAMEVEPAEGFSSGQPIVGGLSGLARSLIASISPPADGKEDEFDALSVESDESYDGYDSELEELDEAFEEDGDEAAYNDFVKSFTDASACGKRLQLTVLFQVLKRWGLPLLDKSPPLSDAELIRQHVQNVGPTAKKMRREIASLAR